jgi:uncharacterized membrane protein YbhN (UPF0104 family)
MAYVLFFGNDATRDLGVLCGMTVLIMGGVGMAIPTPGGTGSYHLFVANTFMAFGVSEKVGTSMAFLMHSTQTIGLLVFGGLSMLLVSVRFKGVVNDELQPDNNS